MEMVLKSWSAFQVKCFQHTPPHKKFRKKTSKKKCYKSFEIKLFWHLAIALAVIIALLLFMFPIVLKSLSPVLELEQWDSKWNKVVVLGHFLFLILASKARSQRSAQACSGMHLVGQICQSWVRLFLSFESLIKLNGAASLGVAPLNAVYLPLEVLL